MNASSRQDRLSAVSPEASNDSRYLVFGQVAEQIDAALRAGRRPDVEALVDQHPDLADEVRQLVAAQALLYDLGHAPEDATSGATAALAETNVPGQLGEYRILREIGRGGMGVVYEAQQVSLDRRVALKVLPFAVVLDQKHLQRFKNEARAAAALDHPHIVHVHSVGCERGVHFYAMQYIEGQTLAQVIDELQPAALAKREVAGAERSCAPDPEVVGAERSRPADPGVAEAERSGAPDPGSQPTSEVVPRHASHRSAETERQGQAAISTEGSTRSPEFFRTVARLGIQAAEALEHAHEMGIVHRDIKPSNLMIDSSGNLWITDFGLAMTQTDANLTMTGDLLGTLRYMSPEQVQAKHGVLDHRTDVYSLGVTLYELLVLRPAFAGQDRQNLLREIVEKEPRPPRQLNRAIPKDLETIVLKATVKEPDSRYATARDLADDLGRFLQQKPIRARRVSSAGRAWRWSRRNPALAASLAVVAGLLLFLAVAGQLVARKQALLHQQDHRHLYMARMMVAKQAWEAGNLRRVRELLDYYDSPGNQEDLRSFEWYYLWKLCQRGLTAPTFEQGGKVWSVAFSPDGKTLATGGPRLTLWIVDTGEEAVKAAFRGLAGNVSALAFSPSGQIVASAGGGHKFGAQQKNFGELRLWDAATGRKLHDLTGHSAPVLCVAFSPDGRLLASGSHDKTARLWAVSTGKPARKLEAHSGRVEALAFSPDGTTLATASGGELMLWEVDSDSKPRRLGNQEGHIDSLKFSPDGEILAAANQTVVELWDLKSRKLIRPLEGHSQQISSVAFSPDGGTLASASADRTTRIWDVATGNVLDVIKGQSSSILSVAFSPDGRKLATGCWDGSVKLWGRSREQPPNVLQGHAERLETMAFSRDGKQLASGSDDGEVIVWDVNTGARQGPLMRHTSRACLVGFLQGGTILASAGDDNKVNFWNLAAGTLQRKISLERAVPGWIFGGPSFAVSPDGTDLAAATMDGMVDLWDMTTGRRLRTLKHGKGGVNCLAFSCDGARLASGGMDMTLKLWDSASGELLHTFVGHGGVINGVAFSPDDKILAAGADAADDATLWDTATGKRLHTLIGTASAVMCLAFSPDGKALATGTYAGILKLWGVATGQERFVLARLDSQISTMAFSADGTTLAVGTWDKEIRLYRAATEEEVQRTLAGND